MIRAIRRRTESLRGLLKRFRASNARERILARISRPIWPRVRQGAAIDAAMGGLGFTLAGVSLLFAWQMLRTPHEAYIPGLQYLAIFAQPNRSALKAAQGSSPLDSAQPTKGGDVDYASTASIPNRRQQPAGGAPPDEPMGYEILSATKDVAWLRRGSQISEVRKGDYVPGLGKIVSIEQEAGRWRLLLEKGAKERRDRPRQDSSAKNFTKPLIFDTPRGRNRQSAP